MAGDLSGGAGRVCVGRVEQRARAGRCGAGSLRGRQGMGSGCVAGEG